MSRIPGTFERGDRVFGRTVQGAKRTATVIQDNRKDGYGRFIYVEWDDNKGEHICIDPAEVRYLTEPGPERNIWGTLKSDIDPDEYCQDCEADIRRGHYDTCPRRLGS